MGWIWWLSEVLLRSVIISLQIKASGFSGTLLDNHVLSMLQKQGAFQASLFMGRSPALGRRASYALWRGDRVLGRSLTRTRVNYNLNKSNSHYLRHDQVPGTRCMVPVSARLWERNAATVSQVLQTEWLTEIARGTLDTARIEQFLAVDEKFLASYWRCLGLLCYTAETEWERALLSEQSQAIFAELDSICALRRAAQKPTRAWPLSKTASNETETTLMVTECRSSSVSQRLPEVCDGYLRLLFDASHALLEALAHASSSTDSLENASSSSGAPWRRERMLLVAVLVPCMSLYAYLGRTLARAQAILEADAPLNAVCKEWVETYTSADFQQRSERLEQLLDSCFEGWCSATGDPDDEVLTLLDTLAYAPAMRFEKALFEAASQLEGSSALGR